jgi:hypothetical protein
MPRIHPQQQEAITNAVIKLLTHNDRTIEELSKLLFEQMGPNGTSVPSVRRLLNTLVNEGVVSVGSKDPGKGGRYRYRLLDASQMLPTVLNQRSGSLIKITDLAITPGINPRLVEAVNYTRVGAAELILAVADGDTKQAANVRRKMLESISLLENIVAMLKSLAYHNGVWVNTVTTENIHLVTAGKVNDRFEQAIKENFDTSYFEALGSVLDEFITTIDALQGGNE